MNTQKYVVSFLFVSCLINKLNGISPCVFDLNPKGIIDLSSVGHVDGSPAWKSIPPETSDKHVYSYNPCHSFTQSNCTDVAACQLYAEEEKLAYSLGTQNSLQWKITSDKEMPTMVYASSERTLYVDLRCLDPGQPNKLEVHGYNTQTLLYTMTLSSVCACWNGCKDGPGPGPSPNPKNVLGTGTIFLILLIAFIFIYLIGFMAFNKFQRQATGGDILPHRTFWISLPGYSFDGVMFVFRKVTRKEAAYTPIK